MAFRVMFTKDEEWPIVFDDDIVPLKGHAKGFRITKCSAETRVVKRNKFDFEAINGFWVDASSAIVDSDGIVNFS
jgi:hypothetical protein